MALLLQSLSAIRIVTQRDLAQASRETIRHLSITFFIFLAEVALLPVISLKY
jgi:Mn2+/Fe2+ NRAMP family transporter